MPILGRETLKRYFETGDGLSNQAFTALIDSRPNLLDTTAQTFNSDIIVAQLVATAGVSIGEANFTQSLLASGANFTGLVKHGVSAATSAATTLGYPVLSQEATVAATATSQIALLPDSANIVGLGVKVLAVSSGAGGGTEIRFGNGAAIDYFGTITVSAPGDYQLVNVSARRLQGVSGAIFAAGITASGGANFLPYVEYYRTAPASANPVRLVEVSALGSAIGNIASLSTVFDGVTDVGAGAAAAIASTRAFAGQAWNDAKTIGQMAIWDPNNEGWNSGGGVVDIRLYGNNANNIDTAVILASVRGASIAPTVVVTVAQTEIDTANAYTYHWAHISGGGGANNNYIAEVRFWELVV